MKLAQDKIPEKGFYTHYKHDPNGELHNYTYEVIGIGRNTEENTYTVLYRPLYTKVYANETVPADYHSRPFDMFIGNVVVDGVEKPLFARITDPAVITELEGVKKKMYGIGH